MLSELTVFLRGSCRFSGTGDFPERFLNLCARSDMGLWDIKRSDDGISACVIACRYRKLLPIARRCGLRLKVTEKKGLPFRLTPYRRRPGMPLGFTVFCVLLWFMSLFIWSVDTPNLSPSTEEKLAAALDEIGITVGSLRSEIDAERMSVELQLMIPEITWVGITNIGSMLSIEAKEYEPVVTSPRPGEPCNLIASADGVIMSVDVIRGSVEVLPGQTVVKGDLLVSGVVEHLTGSVQITEAVASVWARTTRTISCTMPFNQLVPSRTGRVITRHRIRLLGLEIPLLMKVDTDGTYERETSFWQLKAGNTELPLEVRTERCYEVEYLPVVCTADRAESLAIAELEKQLSAMNDIEILEKSVKTSCSDSGVTVEYVLTVKEDIASVSRIRLQ